jgi:CubicO group peptidase (beta-lactamase class C family)
LKDGKIVVEEYWGMNLLNNAPFSAETQWYWASAGKTLTAMLVGIAQEQRLLSIDQRTSNYLGEGWTSMPAAQEEKILIHHQLTMTTGLDYQVNNLDCTEPECLEYKAEPGEQWFYHNAPYTLLESVVSNAAGMSYNIFTDRYVEEKIGMDGAWLPLGDNNVYFSTARDAARFGSLLLNNGDWNTTSILGDKQYLENLHLPSQNLNPSYGYLTWLNGQSAIILPGLPIAFNFSLAADAPSDLYAAMGKNGQYIDVVPSQNLVVIRMGEAPDNSLVPVQFHNDMWAKIMLMLPE